VKITNNTDVSLTLAVWAVHDDYDHQTMPNYISATTLMKPIRQIILAQRLPAELRDQLDVSDLIASAWGNALHSSIEQAWCHGNHATNLKKLGYPDSAINRVVINPTPDQIKPDSIIVYIEQRGTIQVGKWTVGGKFDIVADGRLEDNKSTSAYSWVYGGKDKDYQLQGSIYRLIHRDKILEDHIRINFLFTDWKKSDAKSNPNYPQSRLAHKDIPLMLVEDTQKWVESKLAQIEKYINVPENQLPECTDEELWRSAPVYKYYADPTKLARSTKNFDTKKDADEFMASKGGKGVVLNMPGKVKRCGYCSAFPICTQKDKYEHD
jgi:hypothetical protein